MKKIKGKSEKVIDLAEARQKRRLSREAGSKKAKRGNLPTDKSQVSDRQFNKNSRRRYLAFGVMLVIFLFMGLSMFNIVNLKIQETEAIQLKQKLLNDKVALQSELSLVHSPAYVEQQARTKLKMIKPGETLYIFPEKKEEDPGIEEKTD